jgi:mRNA interferase MazF
VIVSRDALNESIGVVVVVPCITLTAEKTVYANQALLVSPEGGLGRDSIVLCEQVRAIAKVRLLRKRGQLSPGALAAVDRALAITLDLD